MICAHCSISLKGKHGYKSGKTDVIICGRCKRIEERELEEQAKIKEIDQADHIQKISGDISKPEIQGTF